MKKKSGYLGVLILLAAGMTGCLCPTPQPSPTTELPADTAIPTTPADAGPWKTVLQIKVEQPMRMAAFLDEKVGFTGGAGDPGKAHYTTDGGQTWTLAETSTG